MYSQPQVVFFSPDKEPSPAVPILKLLSQRLTTRGLQILTASNVLELSALPSFEALCIISSSDSYASAIDAAITIADNRNKPVFPILLFRPSKLMPMLKKTQWRDFSSSDFTEILYVLLLALDSVNLACWPNNRYSYDGELVLANTLYGLSNPDWDIYRALTRPQKTFTPVVLISVCFSILLVSIRIWIDYPNLEFDIGVGIVSLLITSIGLYGTLWQSTSNSPLLVISKNGFLLATSTSTKFFDFALIKSLDRQIIKILDKQGVYFDSTHIEIYLNVIFADATKTRLLIPLVFSFSPGDSKNYSLSKYYSIPNKIINYYDQFKEGNQAIVLKSEKDFFISYSHSDAHALDDIEENMRLNKVRCWVDRTRLRVGVEWKQEIESAIERSVALILLVSPTSLNSPFVKYEYETALRLGKPVIGVLIKKCKSISPVLRPLIRVDYRKYRPFMGFMAIMSAIQMESKLRIELDNAEEKLPIWPLARAFGHAPNDIETVYYARKINLISLITFILMLALFIIISIGKIYLSEYMAMLLQFTLPIYMTNVLTRRNALLVLTSSETIEFLANGSHYFKFAKLQSFDIVHSNPIEGTICKYRQNNSTKEFVVPSIFQNHRLIAKEIRRAIYRVMNGQGYYGNKN